MGRFLKCSMVSALSWFVLLADHGEEMWGTAPLPTLHGSRAVTTPMGWFVFIITADHHSFFLMIVKMSRLYSYCVSTVHSLHSVTKYCLSKVWHLWYSKRFRKKRSCFNKPFYTILVLVTCRNYLNSWHQLLNRNTWSFGISFLCQHDSQSDVLRWPMDTMTSVYPYARL